MAAKRALVSQPAGVTQARRPSVAKDEDSDGITPQARAIVTAAVLLPALAMLIFALSGSGAGNGVVEADFAHSGQMGALHDLAQADASTAAAAALEALSSSEVGHIEAEKGCAAIARAAASAAKIGSSESLPASQLNSTTAVVSAALRKHAPHSNVVVSCAGALRNLAVVSGRSGPLFAAGAGRAIAAAVKVHANSTSSGSANAATNTDSVAAIEAACNALAALGKDVDGREVLRKHAGIAVDEALRADASDSRVAAACLPAVMFMSSAANNQAKMARNGTAAAVGAVMTARGDADLATALSGAKILSNLALAPSVRRVLVQNASAAKRLVSALRSHPSDVTMADVACGGLYLLASARENVADIIKAGAGDAVSKAMAAHGEANVAAAKSCAAALWALGSAAPQREALLKAGAGPALITALHAHSGRDADVAHRCAAALATLALVDEARSALLEAGGADAARAAVVAHPGRLEVVKAGELISKAVLSQRPGTPSCCASALIPTPLCCSLIGASSQCKPNAIFFASNMCRCSLRSSVESAVRRGGRRQRRHQRCSLAGARCRTVCLQGCVAGASN